MNKSEVRVTVVTDDDGKTIVNVKTPTNQQSLDTRQMAHVLVGGIALLIKSCNNQDLGIKDHELMKEVTNHLNESFTDDSYDDAHSDASIIKNKNNE
jgi:hypothetical protein